MILENIYWILENAWKQNNRILSLLGIAYRTVILENEVLTLENEDRLESEFFLVIILEYEQQILENSFKLILI